MVMARDRLMCNSTENHALIVNLRNFNSVLPDLAKRVKKILWS